MKQAVKFAKVEQQKNELKSSQTSLGKCVLGCLGGLFIHLVIGSLYQWGILSIYFTSYFRGIDNSVNLESTAIGFPLMMVFIGLTMRAGLYLSSLTHPLIVLAAGQVLSALSIFVSSYMTHIWLFFLFYGILFGLIAGLSFMIPIFQCNKYFPGKAMYINGFILIGTGLGSTIFGIFSYSFLNPEKLPHRNGYYLQDPALQQITQKTPALLRWLSLLYIVIGLLGMLMLSPVCLQNRRKQNQQKLKEKQVKDIKQTSEVILEAQITDRENPLTKTVQLTGKYQAGSILQAFRSRVFWISVFMLFVGSNGCYLISGNYKTYVKKTINDDQFLTIIGVLGGVANGFSRFLWNLFFSKTGYKTTILTILAIPIIVLSTIRFTVQQKRTYLVQVFFINATIGGFLGTTPTFVQKIYGQVTGSNIYGVYWVAFALSNFLQYILLSNVSSQIGFDNLIYICLAMAILAVPIVIFTKFQGPWENSTESLEYCVHIENRKKQENQQQRKVAQYHPGNMKPQQFSQFCIDLRLGPLKQEKVDKTSKEL